MLKEIKSENFTVLSRCFGKIFGTITHVKLSVQKCEVTRVICLHELLWLNALWLGAAIYTVDAKVSDLFYIKFSSLSYENIYCYEIVKTCYI